jgi:hypothetical protein
MATGSRSPMSLGWLGARCANDNGRRALIARTRRPCVIAAVAEPDQPSKLRADCGSEFDCASMAMLACCRIEFRVSCAVS